jgi:prepilin-type N-terminal cleavage/methylation domain-containing protein
VNNASKAFTFIEMMVVIMLIGILASIMIPRFATREPKADWSTVIDELNNLVFFARQEAIANQHVYRLTLTNIPGRPINVIVQEEKINPEKPGRIYVPTFSYYFKPDYTLHESISLKAFFNGREKILSEGDKGQAYCYVIPEGLVQETTIQLVRRDANGEHGVTLSMMPFYGTFTLQEGFKRPE